MLRKLQDYRQEIYFCVRCSYCKWLDGGAIKSHRFSQVCPSIVDGNFHAYSGGGKLNLAWSFLQGRVPYSEKMLDVIYRCNMCGTCDIGCQVNMGELIPVNEILHALRAKCVEDGQALPEHVVLVDNMKKEDNVLGEPKAKRGDWAEGLRLKDAIKKEVDVLFHAGCRFSYDQDLRDIIRENALLLEKAGVDFGIAGREEACCGLRAFDIGFTGEMKKYAEDISTRIKTSGAKILVTPCADCYSAFKYYYPWIGVKLNVEILHITEYLDRLIKGGKLKLKKEVAMRVAYHDPCHLGKLGEVYQPWDGKWVKVLGHMPIPEPPRHIPSGEDGVYEPPRNVLRNIPGLKVVEMERTGVYSWCCGAGGGALEAFPDFAHRTAMERVAEARAAGAEALVTSCPWCERNFKDAMAASEDKLPIYDLVELLKESVE